MKIDKSTTLILNKLISPRKIVEKKTQISLVIMTKIRHNKNNFIQKPWQIAWKLTSKTKRYIL